MFIQVAFNRYWILSRPGIIQLGWLVLTAAVMFSCGGEKKNEKTQDRLLKPEDNRFTPVSLTQAGSLNEPMVFEVLREGTVYIAERGGSLKKYDPAAKAVSLVATIPVFKEYEQGLVGFSLDPNFTDNHWIYLYYAHPTESKMVLTRWELVNDQLMENSRKVLFEVPVEREGTSHTGGGMTWDQKGNLYITTGNNSGNSYSSQTDERPGRNKWDDQRSAANTNDLRGKILRIHPEPDGSYSIPEGNLFPKGTPQTRPEIYTMGNRNPWRPSLDTKSGWLYWGEIGPDADKDTKNGPRGYDEFNQARQAGFFGWPYFIGENHAYPMFDYFTDQPGEKQDAAKPINKSVNNTGLQKLPPAQPAFIAYPYAVSEKYPLVGSSSRCAIGGPIYHQSDFSDPQHRFPAYYEGKWLAADLSRFWIMAITMDENGNYKSMERFLPDYHPRQPIDLKFGRDGGLYVLEYGGSTAKSSLEARLVRIEYNAGNRSPLVEASASKRGGTVPLKLTLSAAGTRDYDKDELTYEWNVASPAGSPQVFTAANPDVILNKEGIYLATLTVTDANGAKNSDSIRIIAGNEPPQVEMQLAGNKHFFFPGKPIRYQVNIRDKEDGSLSGGTIHPSTVAVSIDYVSGNFDVASIDIKNLKVDTATQFAVASALIRQSDCSNCHNPDKRGVGPAYIQIAERYKSDSGALSRLAKKVISGGSGVWGQVAMPAHPSLSIADASTMVRYILKINAKGLTTLPLNGSYTAAIPEGDAAKGVYVIQAAYSDKPTQVPSLTSQHILVLRSPKLIPTDADIIQGGAVRDQLDDYTFLTAKPNSYIAFNRIDLTAVKQIELRPNWHLYDIYMGGNIEVRLDSPAGELLGETEIKEEHFNIKKMPGGMNKFWGGPQVSDRNMKTTSSKVAIKEVKGVHNLYFVFKNEKATTKDSLFPLASITLYDEIQ